MQSTAERADSPAVTGETEAIITHICEQTTGPGESDGACRYLGVQIALWMTKKPALIHVHRRRRLF